MARPRATRDALMLAAAVAAVAAGVLGAAPVPAQQGASGPAPPDVSRKPAYWRDPRFEKEIRFPPPRARSRAAGTEEPRVLRYLEENGGDPTQPDSLRPVRVLDGRLISGFELVETLRKATGARVFLEPDLLRETLLVPLDVGPARELMDEMPRNFQGAWQQIGDAWVLTRWRTSWAGRYIVLSPEERRQREESCMRDLLRSLTPQQWETLCHGGRLLRGTGDMTREQEWLAHQTILLRAFDTVRPLEAPLPEEMLRGWLTLSLAGSGRQALLELRHPQQDYRLTIPFYDAQGQLLCGVPPPR